jgi:flagellar hook-associated protein 2
VETAGVDVAGTIGGVAATGSGQTLTGNGSAVGLALIVKGGATGDRGTVRFARGYAFELQKTATDLLADNSPLDSRIDGINASIKGLDDRREDLQTRLAATEARLRKQYSTLDSTMSKMQSMSASLTQQLASLPRI